MNRSMSRATNKATSGAMQLLLLSMLTMLVSPSWAAQAGQLLFARGTVSIVDDNRFSRGASTGSTFDEGETVLTGARSIAQLRLSDGALLALRSNSEYRIEKQVFDEAEDIYEQAGRLVAGWMRSVTGAIGARRPQKVSQSTSVATIGVRGTAYQVIHVPEEGLAGFPELAPGSYLYLEEGALEVASEGGSWMMRPGDVLEVPAAGGAPRLAPKLRRLFFGNDERDIAAQNRRDEDGLIDVADNDDDDDDRRISLADDDDDSNLIADNDDINDALEDTVDDTLPNTFPEFSGDVGGVAAVNDVVRAIDVLSGSVEFEGSGANKFAAEMESIFGGPAIFLQGQDDNYRPINTGSRLIRNSEGEIATQVHWGTWQVNQFSAQRDPGTGLELLPAPGNWHYMIADNVVTTDVLSTVATGVIRYSYTAGTPFLNSATGTNGALLMTDNSYLDVDLGELGLAANLFFDNGLNLSGSGGFEDLFDGAILLDNGGPVTPTVIGNMSGAFVGEGLEGLITGINFSDLDTNDQFAGTALFQKPIINLGGSQPPVTTPFGGVIASTVVDLDPPGGFNAVNGVFFPADADIRQSSGDMPFLFDVTIGDEGYRLSGIDGSEPAVLNMGSIVDVDSSVVADVFWGLWADGDVSVSAATVVNAELRNWHFIIANNTLSLADAQSLGPLGEVSYVLSGGLAMTDTASISSERLQLGGGTAMVDFGMQEISMSLSVDSTVNSFLGVASGTGTFMELYESGIQLNDNINLNGSFVGSFVGSTAEGLIGAVTLTDELNSGDTFAGTAAFQREFGSVGP